MHLFADKKINLVALENGVFTLFSGANYFLMTDKMIDFGCVVK